MSRTGHRFGDRYEEEPLTLEEYENRDILHIPEDLKDNGFNSIREVSEEIKKEFPDVEIRIIGFDTGRHFVPDGMVFLYEGLEYDESFEKWFEIKFKNWYPKKDIPYEEIEVNQEGFRTDDHQILAPDEFRVGKEHDTYGKYAKSVVGLGVVL